MPSFSLTGNMMANSAIYEFFQGGIQFPSEGQTQERDVVFTPDQYRGFLEVLQQSMNAGTDPETMINGNPQPAQPNGSAQLEQAAEDIYALEGLATPIPLPAGTAPFEGAAYPQPTSSRVNASVKNVTNSDGSVDIVLQRVSSTNVENYPEGMSFNSLKDYNTYQQSNPPVVDDGGWTLLFPDPNSSDYVSLPKFTVKDPGAAKLEITAGWSEDVVQGDTLVALPPSAIAWIDKAVSDLGDGIPVDPGPNPSGDLVDSEYLEKLRQDPTKPSDYDGGDETGPNDDDPVPAPAPAPDPDQPQPDPIDPIDDDGEG